MRLYGAIEKVEALDDGTVRVHGIASSEAVDDQSEIVKGEAIRAALPDYMLFPALREMHQLSAAGTTLEAEVGPDAVTRIVAHVVDPIAVSKVKNRVYRGFSIGGRVTQRDPANSKTITGLVLNEISLVDRPANPEAVLDVWKASSMEGQQTATAAPFNAPLQIWACGDPSHRHIAKADAVKCLEAGAVDKSAENSDPVDTPPEQPTPDEIERSAADGAASAQALIDAALKAVEDGEVALAKAEPEPEPDDTVAKDNGDDMGETAKDNGDGGDMGEAAKDGEDMGEAAKDGDKPYGDVAYADPGHKADGKKRYPIDTEAHIRAAWSYINQEKNHKGYTAGQVASIKSKIVSAWKSKIDKDGPPSASKKNALGKSLWDIGEVAMLIAGLRSMCERLELERAMEGDDSALPESCEAVCASACGLLMAMCAEETQEVLNDTEIDEPVGPQMNAMMMSAIAQSLVKAGVDPEKVEQLMEELGKVGARHRAEVQAQLNYAAFATSAAMDVGDLRRAEMMAAGDAHKAVLDAGAVAWGPAITGRQMLTDGNPTQGGGTQNATQDTGGNGLTAVPNPTGAVPASPWPKVAKTTDAADLPDIEAMIKANKGGKALLRAAHDLICNATGGATCKEDTPKPGHISGRDMASMHKCHGYLTAVDGVGCGEAAKAAPAAAPEAVGEPETQAAVDTAKVADAAPAAPVAAPEQVWEVARVERDDLSKALASERAEKGELLKTIGAIVPMLDRLTKRVDQIAETPIPGRAHSGAGVAINKGQDYGGSGLSGGGSLGARPSFDTVLKSMPPEVLAAYDALPADDQSMLMIKHSLGQPISYDPVKRVLVTP